MRHAPFIHPKRFHVSKNFRLDEVFRSETAYRNGIRNLPEPSARHHASQVLRNARILARDCLQLIRDEFGIVWITSWYRSLELNLKMFGDNRSQHLDAAAADFGCGEDLVETFLWIVEESGIQYDQVIYERRKGGRSEHRWIHISKEPGREQRGQALISLGVNQYKPYIKGDRIV